MSPDAQVVAWIDKAFAGSAKPEHFTDYTHCCECAEHDQLLIDRDRQTLRIEDVGNAGWDPICFCSAAGIAYYFPALARFSLAPPTREFGWYGDQLMFHLTSGLLDNRFLQHCNAAQREAVAALLRRLEDNLPSGEAVARRSEFAQARMLWTIA
jgi:hypothetical protein